MPLKFARATVLPINHGEKCVVRILDDRAISVGLNSLGMAPETLKAFSKQILQPHGIVLVTGPTGSGKFTTLFAGKEALLPAPTLTLMAISNFMRTRWYLVLAGGGAELAGLTVRRRTFGFSAAVAIHR